MHHKKLTNKQIGYTVVELLIVLVILSLLFLMLTPVFFFPKKTNDIMKRLDVYHESRKINHAINLRIKLSYDINFPPSNWSGQVKMDTFLRYLF